MRIGLIVSGGFDRSGRERVTPSLLWLVERLARRHDVHVFVLHYYPERKLVKLGSRTHYWTQRGTKERVTVDRLIEDLI